MTRVLEISFSIHNVKTCQCTADSVTCGLSVIEGTPSADAMFLIVFAVGWQRTNISEKRPRLEGLGEKIRIVVDGADEGVTA